MASVWMRACVALGSLSAVAGVAGCRGEAVIEAQPVAEIDVSAPPRDVAAAEAPVLYDDFGIRLVDGTRRIYDAVVPVGAVDISHSDKETRFYVPDMRTQDVEKFLEKYFPYQERQFFYKTKIFEVYRTIKPEFASGDAIVPDLNPNVFKPEHPISMVVFFNQSQQRYEWVYRDFAPFLPQAQPEPQPEVDVPVERRKATLDEAIKYCDSCRAFQKDKKEFDPEMKVVCTRCEEAAMEMSEGDIEKYRLRVDWNK